MNYFICQDWENTSKNHAGIKYLCKQIELNHSDECKCYVIPDYISKLTTLRKKSKFVNKICFYIAQYQFKFHIRSIIKQLIVLLKDDDKIFLMEYMELLYPQYNIAKVIKKEKPKVKIYAIVHLIPQRYTKDFSDKLLNKWITPIDKILTLGSSLSKYLEERGVDKTKICTTFHYVDTNYYRKKNNINNKVRPVTVIVMGNNARNEQLLKEVVDENPYVHFIICQGLSDMSILFANNNVRLIPFVPEDELRSLMEESDISLNIMNDTIGSNVIVTSLAMELAMVVSDVGSIRDYCNDNNTIFCKNNDIKSFRRAIMFLSTHKEKLTEMKKQSKLIANKLTIEKFYNEITNI